MTRNQKRLRSDVSFNYNPNIIIERRGAFDQFILIRPRRIIKRRMSASAIPSINPIKTTFTPRSILKRVQNVPIGIAGRPRRASTSAISQDIPTVAPTGQPTILDFFQSSKFITNVNL